MANKKPKRDNLEPVKKKELVSAFKSERFYALFIFSFSILLYFNSVFNDYNMDDELVTQNHRLTSKGISAIPEIFSSPYYADKSGYKYEYRPMVLASFAIEHSFFGEHAWVSHLINVLLYSLLCLILFKVLRKLFQSYNILFPFLITLFFAAYPLHTEVVASIKNRDEILALIFGLMSLYFSILFSSKKKVIYLLAACLFFLFGILSKTTTITFALLIPLSLVLFSEISFSYLMMITTVLAIPAIIFARLYSVTQQAGLFLLLIAVAITFYGFKYYRRNNSIKKFISENLNWIIIKEGPSLLVEHPLNFGFLKHWRFVFSFTVVIFSTVIISAAGIFFGIYWVAGLLLFGLALFFMVAREELKLLLVIPVTLISILYISKIHYSASCVESALLVFLGGIILYQNKTFKIVGIVSYLLYSLAVVIINHHSFYFLTGSLFFVMLDRRIYRLSYLGAVLISFFYLKRLFVFGSLHESFDMSLLNTPIVIAAAVLVWRKKNNRMLYSAVLLIAAFVSFTPPINQTHVFNSIEKKYSQISHVRATDITPVQTVRPFNFIEIPVSNNDPLMVKLGTSMLVLGKYLKLLIIPYPMSFYYGYSYISPVAITDPVPLLTLVVYLALLLVALFFFRKSRMLAFSILFYLISISVFSDLFLQVPGMMGDRFLFIPSIGFCFFLVFILSKFFKQDWDKKLNWEAMKQPMKISLSVILLLYSLLTFSRNMDWKDRITLFSHDIKSVENSAQAQNLLGLHLMIASNNETDAMKQRQMREESLIHLKRAVEIYPKFLNATFDRGRLLELLQRYDEALVAYREATVIDSTFTTPYFAMGVIYQNKGREEEAAECYEKYLPKHPTQMEVYANLSYSYFKQKLFDKSIATNKRALAVNAGAVDPYINLGKTFMQINQRDSALYYFEMAHQLRPDDPNINGIVNQLKTGK